MMKKNAFLTLLFVLLFSFSSVSQTADPKFWVPNALVRAIAKSGNTIYLGGDFTSIGPNTPYGQVLDATTGSAVLSSSLLINGNVNAVAPDGSGGWYIGGSFSKVLGQTRNNLARINADGTLNSWNPDAGNIVYAIAVSGSAVYIGGNFVTIGGTTRNRIASVGTDGTLGAWDPNANNTVMALAVSGSTVYIGGSFTTIGGTTRNRLAAVGTDGTLGNWNPNANNSVAALAVSGSTVYIGGSFTTIVATTRNRIAAVGTDGALGSWNPNANGSVNALAVNGSTVYIGGAFTTIVSTARNRLGAVDASTGNVTAWNPSAGNTVTTLVVNGTTVYIGGAFTTMGATTRNYIAAVNTSDGAVTNWDPNANYTVRAFAISGTNVFVGGNFTSINRVTRNRLAALDVTTGAVTSWDPNAGAQVYALAVSGSTVYIGGRFNGNTGINGNVTRNRLAAVDATTGIATSWDPNANGTVNALAVSGSNVYIGGLFSGANSINGSFTRNRLAAVDATTGNATSWDPNANNTVNALIVSGSTLYIGGAFNGATGINGNVTRNYLAAVDATTGTATGWDPNANSSVYALAISGSTVYIGGYFSGATGINGNISRNRLAAVDATTGTATNWDPNAGSTVNALALSGSTVYIGGSFISINPSLTRYSLAAVGANSGTATSWNPNATAGLTVNALLVSGYKVYAGGDFTTIGSLPQAYFGVIPLLSTTYTVTSASETGPGTLKALIAGATDGDIITFDVATMGGNTIKLTSPIVIDKDLTIRGADGGIILDGNKVTRVITIKHGCEARLEKLIVKNGNDPLLTVGGVLNEGKLTLVNCVVSNNKATGSKAVGGLRSYDNSATDGDLLTLINTTIAGNTGDSSDGTGGLNSEDEVNIYNSIIYGNTGFYSDVDGTINAIARSYNSLYGNNVSSKITIGSGNLFGVDPKFTGGNTHPYSICGNSSAVDAGDNSYNSETTDLRGAARKLNKSDGTAGTVDMGAYEWRSGTDPLLLTWDGSESDVWNLAANWDLNQVPESKDVVKVPDVTSKPIFNTLTVSTDGELTIDPKGTLTLSGMITNNGKIVIKSGAGWTGSLITGGNAGTGSALVERYMPEGEWHIISSPTASQKINDFIADNTCIPLLSGTSPVQYGMMDYSPGSDSWNSYFTAANTSELGVGRGYMVRVKNPVDNLRFQGGINTGTTTSVSAGWNCIGNPFTSAIRVNAAAGDDNFMTVNSGLFDDNNKALYLWNQTSGGGTGNYDVVNLADGAAYAQVGQGFFMKVKAAASDPVSFTTAMQIHQIAAPFKSSAAPYPEIKLIATANNRTVSTDIKFIEGTKKGLDPGYDAGLFTTDKSYAIYTKLVEDNGIKFQLQCLPPTGYDKMVIPVGIDSKSAGEIVFSVETVQLEAGCKVILEDKLTNTYTDLSVNSYKAIIAADTKGADRFFLHTGDIISGLEDQSLADGKLTAYANGNKEIRVIGEVGEGAVATLVNGLGQVVLTKRLGAGNLNIIGLPNLTSGLYMLNINDKGMPQTIKIMIRK